VISKFGTYNIKHKIKTLSNPTFEFNRLCSIRICQKKDQQVIAKFFISAFRDIVLIYCDFLKEKKYVNLLPVMDYEMNSYRI
jgi:hypothetical protein